jgi:hypothetical protein
MCNLIAFKGRNFLEEFLWDILTLDDEDTTLPGNVEI